MNGACVGKPGITYNPSLTDRAWERAGCGTHLVGTTFLPRFIQLGLIREDIGLNKYVVRFKYL